MIAPKYGEWERGRSPVTTTTTTITTIAFSAMTVQIHTLTHTILKCKVSLKVAGSNAASVAEGS